MVSRKMQNKLGRKLMQAGVISIKELSKQNLIREQDGKKPKIIKGAGPNKSEQGGKFSQNS